MADSHTHTAHYNKQWARFARPLRVVLQTLCASSEVSAPADICWQTHRWSVQLL